MGDENPPDNRKRNDLDGLETIQNVEENQRSAKSTVSNFQPHVREAAMWLCRNPLISHPVVTIRRRFALTVMEATEAAKLAHALNRGEHRG
ncbi:hypothetical protein [Agrobacterium deltaense]|uniref:hypothetical protein n=1 Tax=Agrobacterium deltaense TaxID=1183412 RepID=UPI00196965A1|nr:hypothetical protein [Agrobacterium deltaense]